ncbi:MAG: hypothetical protein IPK37_04635 [Austwickia sp.]|nr:MAG: hypothetical protein IPK37_04635 [Austwickia sp.]
MRAAVLQVAYDDAADPAVRREAVAARVREVGAGVDLVVLPELWLAGAFTARRWRERAEPLDGPTCTVLAEAARDAGCVLHGGSIIETPPPDDEAAAHGHLYNTAPVFGPDGAVLAAYRKIHCFGAGGVEKELLEPGHEPCVLELPLPAAGASGAGTSVRAGLATCYDLRFPELFRALARDEPELMIVSASWPAARAEVWSLLLRARALENQAFVLGCAAAGINGKTAMSGASAVFGPAGDLLAESPGPADGEGPAPDDVLICEFDPADATSAREAFPVLADRRLDRC